MVFFIRMLVWVPIVAFHALLTMVSFKYLADGSSGTIPAFGYITCVWFMVLIDISRTFVSCLQRLDSAE